MRGAGARYRSHSLAACSGSTGGISAEIHSRRVSPSAQAVSCAPDSPAKRIVQLSPLPPPVALSTITAAPQSLSASFEPSARTQRLWLDHLYQQDEASAAVELDHRLHSSAAASTAPPAPDTLLAQLDSPSRPAGRHLSIFGGGCPGGDKDPDFYANVGSAIRTLRDEIPTLFYKDLSCALPRLSAQKVPAVTPDFAASQRLQSWPGSLSLCASAAGSSGPGSP